jgi:hypothetical protein
MVLISHEKEFIFIKTQKSASSSIEEYLEYHLLGTPPEGFGEYSPERATDDGYVSGRGMLRGKKPFMRHHADSSEILNLLGEQRFMRYQKATCVRNPWDQIVSYFWWRLRVFPRLASIASKAPMVVVKLWFSIWYFTRRSRLKSYSFTHLLSVEGKIPPMHIIRFESLEADLRDLLKKQGLSMQEQYLPTRKSHLRLRPEGFQKYYFGFVRNAVARDRSRDLKNFGYQWKRD